MKIAIIGHGNVGGALAKSFSAGQHSITIGATNPRNERALELGRLYDIEVATIGEAAESAEVVINATPAHAAQDVARSLGPLEGKILIDASNAIGQLPDPYPTAFHAFQDLTRAEIVKCFNTTGFENMLDPKYGDQAADMFVAGENDRAKQVAAQLARDAGFAECYDFGGADKVIALEALAYAWVNLAIIQGQGRQMAWKVLKR